LKLRAALLGRAQAWSALQVDTVNLVGPETLTGSGVAAIWSDVLGRTVVYGGAIRPASRRI